MEEGVIIQSRLMFLSLSTAINYSAFILLCRLLRKTVPRLEKTRMCFTAPPERPDKVTPPHKLTVDKSVERNADLPLRTVPPRTAKTRVRTERPARAVEGLLSEMRATHQMWRQQTLWM